MKHLLIATALILTSSAAVAGEFPVKSDADQGFQSSHSKQVTLPKMPNVNPNQLQPASQLDSALRQQIERQIRLIRAAQAQQQTENVQLQVK